METLVFEVADKEKAKALKAVAKALGATVKTQKNGVKKSEEDSPYDPVYVAKVLESKKQYEEGKYKVIKTEDLWK